MFYKPPYFSDSKSRNLGREPANVEAMEELARILAASTSPGYQYGRAASLNEYSADGTVFDFMAGRRKVSYKAHKGDNSNRAPDKLRKMNFNGLC